MLRSRIPKPEEMLEDARQKNGGDVPRPAKKPLVLSYELTWRNDNDKKFLRSTEWKNTRKAVLMRDDYTCSYCGFKTKNTRQLHVHHVDGVPQNQEFSNLETICNQCHMIQHSGFWASIQKVLIIFEQATVSQEEVIRITREMRAQGKSDEEIIKACGLEKETRWAQDHEFLKNKIGFVTSRNTF